MPIEHPFPSLQRPSAPTPPQQQTLWHYTNLVGLKGILASCRLNPSLKACKPKDARYGDGQYLSDIRPGTRTLEELANCFVRWPCAGQRYTHYVEVDVTGLEVVRCRIHVFLVPGSKPLDLDGRMVSWGAN